MDGTPLPEKDNQEEYGPSQEQDETPAPSILSPAEIPSPSDQREEDQLAIAAGSPPLAVEEQPTRKVGVSPLAVDTLEEQRAEQQKQDEQALEEQPTAPLPATEAATPDVSDAQRVGALTSFKPAVEEQSVSTQKRAEHTTATPENNPTPGKRTQRKRRWLLTVAACLVLVLVVSIPIYAALQPRPGVAAGQPTATPTATTPIKESGTGDNNGLTATPTTAQPTATATPSPTKAHPTPTRSTGGPPPTPTPFHNPANLTYHGGYVQVHPSSYLIFWGANWQTDSAAQATKQLVESYFQHVPGSSYASVLHQYSMTNADGSQSFISGPGSSQSWIGSTDPTPDGPTCGSAGAAVSDAAIQQEIAHARSSNGWSADAHTATYFVYLLPGVAVYEPGMGCSNVGVWGADHEFASIGGATVAYAVMPYPWITPCSFPPYSFSSDAACKNTKLVSYSAHEQFEAATDPLTPRAGSTNFQNIGWFYNTPFDGEISDVCLNDHRSYSLGGTTFLLQAQWSNQANGCV